MSGLRLAVLAFGACIITGCAMKSDLEAVRDQVTEVERKADEALAAAQGAKELAQDANARSARSEEMLNRGFKRSMYK